MGLVTGIAQAIGGSISGLDWNLSGGGNVFEDHMPEDPDIIVSVYSSGGNEADSALPYDSPGIQIVVRGSKDPSVATALWYRIYDYLHGKRNVGLPDNTYLVYALATQSSPIPMGPDQKGRYRFSMNLRCEIINATEHRPEYDGSPWS